jgi:hypothetical protein
MSQYNFVNAPEEDKKYLPSEYRGDVYRISNRWIEIIPLPDKEIKILEIGCYHGANVCSLVKTYATHPKSTIHCVDPWIDYQDYHEYKSQQYSSYSNFLHNISKLDANDVGKIYIYRDLSENIIPDFRDKLFDMIYIDGNHEKEFIVMDLILSLKKIKNNGWIIIDDIQSENVRDVIKSILPIYSNIIGKVLINNGQMFIHMK